MEHAQRPALGAKAGQGHEAAVGVDGQIGDLDRRRLVGQHAAVAQVDRQQASVGGGDEREAARLGQGAALAARQLDVVDERAARPHHVERADPVEPGHERDRAAAEQHAAGHHEAVAAGQRGDERIAPAAAQQHLAPARDQQAPSRHRRGEHAGRHILADVVHLDTILDRAQEQPPLADPQRARLRVTRRRLQRAARLVAERDAVAQLLVAVEVVPPQHARGHEPDLLAHAPEVDQIGAVQRAARRGAERIDPLEAVEQPLAVRAPDDDVPAAARQRDEASARQRSADPPPWIGKIAWIGVVGDVAEGLAFADRGRLSSTGDSDGRPETGN